MERPSSLAVQASTFSSYKNRNTVKVLVAITPSGAICFMSPLFEGSVSDKKLMEQSGLLVKLEDGDELMADKGFKIQDILAPYGIRLTVPPFLGGEKQMSAREVVKTKNTANVRVHVERAIGRIKYFRILQSVIEVCMWDSLNEIVYVCCMLANAGPPLVF